MTELMDKCGLHYIARKVNVFIAIKDSKIISVSDHEWLCRKEAKGIETKEEYFTWLESVKTASETLPDNFKTPDYSGEDYEVHECEGDYETWYSSGYIVPQIGDVTLYHLSWDGSSVSADDESLEAAKLGAKWTYVRTRRNSMLLETDWIVTKAKETGTNISAAWKAYRQELRDITEQSDPDNITWPTKPS